MKKITKPIIACALIALLSACILSGCDGTGAGKSGYIDAPYDIDEEMQGPTEYLEPVFYENENGPTIGVTLCGVIEEDGLYFKDSDNDGELDPYEDWRVDTDERIEDLLSKMSAKQRVGLLVTQATVGPLTTEASEVYDENGNVCLNQLIDITPDALDMEMTERESYSNTTGEILTNQSRSGVIRQDLSGMMSALWVNALDMVCEYGAAATGEPMIPFTVIQNPVDEGTGAPEEQGFAAAVMGDVADGGDYSLIEEYANTDREIWYAKGINRMYGPQIDLITDPRWSRDYSTYTEDPDVMSGIATALVTGYQNGTDGVQEGDVAVIVKHFPGDGASYNGLESHLSMGKYRIYSTEGSLEEYQLVGFQAAIDAGAAGVMPGYSMQADDGYYGSVLQSYRGTEIPSDGVANAYSSTMLQTLLRDTMGFDGFVNTDTGVLLGGRRYYGEEDSSDEERFARLINSGCDIISDQLDGIDWNIAYMAYNDGLIDEEAIDRANTNTLKVMFEQGLFENPYKDFYESGSVVEEKTEELQAVTDEINQKSVVLLKNSNNVLPLSETYQKVYIRSFTVDGSDEDAEQKWKEAFEDFGYTIVDSLDDADVAFLDIVPGGINIDIDHVGVLDLVDGWAADEINYPYSSSKTGESVDVTTLKDAGDIAEISDIVHGNNGIVISSIDISNPWILTNLEPYCDGLIASFSSSIDARIQVLTGGYSPTGKLPVTLPACNEVVALVEETDEYGNTYESCVSPNDVPGYDKDLYMDEDVLAQSPSGSYAYQDKDGNIYRAWFGLSYQEE